MFFNVSVRKPKNWSGKLNVYILLDISGEERAGGSAFEVGEGVWTSGGSLVLRRYSYVSAEVARASNEDAS